MGLADNRVAISKTGLDGYPTQSPFHPGESFPECVTDETDVENKVYGWVRETLRRLGLDAENYGMPEWNPLKDIVKPGMTVLIKPNTVRHYHMGGGDIQSVIIHASILRPILDYVSIALKGEGRILIGDSQVTEGLFDEALEAAQIDQLLEWFRAETSVPVECIDFRINRTVRTWMYGKWGRKKIEADPRGYTFVDLGDESYFRDIDPKKLRIGIASYKVMYEHHSGGRHEYLFPNSVLQADAIINIPKMKTHRRTGITIAVKNFMGLPALKDCLPHFQTGSPEENGDQYMNPSVRKRICTHLHDIIQTHPLIPVKFVCAVIKKLVWNSHRIIPFKDDIYEAMWYGNDTLWRTLLDLNRAALYADAKGKLQDTPQRNYICIMDGIIGGENMGPVSPDPVHAGILAAGFNPIAIDSVVSSLMGFDPQKIPTVQRGFEEPALFHGSPDDVMVLEDGEPCPLSEFEQNNNLHFVPHPDWKGHIER